MHRCMAACVYITDSHSYGFTILPIESDAGHQDPWAIFLPMLQLLSLSMAARST